jgi:hypothetical protein
MSTYVHRGFVLRTAIVPDRGSPAPNPGGLFSVVQQFSGVSVFLFRDQNSPMPLQLHRPSRADTFSARIQRARDEGYSRGFAEGVLFRLAVGKTSDRGPALDWLDNVIEEGRTDLMDQHASGREVEAWDMSCRIAFLVEIIR